MAILYGDVMTDSMKAAIGETDRRRTRQLEWNIKMGITPIGVQKRIKDIIEGAYDPDEARKEQRAAQAKAKYEVMPEKDMQKELKALEKQMLDRDGESCSAIALSIVIPVFNEEKVFAAAFSRVESRACR